MVPHNRIYLIIYIYNETIVFFKKMEKNTNNVIPRKAQMSHKPQKKQKVL